MLAESVEVGEATMAPQCQRQRQLVAAEEEEAWVGHSDDEDCAET